MGWTTVNTITGPCKCGHGLLRSTHLTDGRGNYDTVWDLTCPDCKAKYSLVETQLVGNPDKTLAMVKYVERKTA